jgi:hypothetical protein
MSEHLEKKVIGALLGFRHGTKTGAEVIHAITALRKSNPLLAEDYEMKYINLVKSKK